MRIFEVARECGVKSDTIIEFLKDKNITVKNRMQNLDDETVKLILDKFKEKKAKQKPKALIEEEKKIEPLEVKPPPLQEIPLIPQKIEKKKPQKQIKTKKQREVIEEDIILNKIISEQKRKLKEEKEELRVIEIQNPILVRDLARKMNVEPAKVLKKLVDGGYLCTLSQPIDAETASTIALDFGFEARVSGLYIEEGREEEDRVDDLKPRPPIVTVMGHVDHGKTTLLDYIRKTNIVATEAGGITQHIGASVVTLDDGRTITFIDTPGHEAFTAMRARGAQVTDIVVLVIAADDGIMPQTIEAIRHAQSANCPIIVAINKSDLPNVSPDRIKQQLVEYNLTPEEWGGKTIVIKISAKTGEAVPQLLEAILFQAEMMELKANPHRKATATIIESRIDPKIGIIGAAIVKRGTLEVGDTFVCGSVFGKIRNMFNDKMEPITVAHPSHPVLILGFNELPEVGDKLTATLTEREARIISEKRKELTKTDRLNVRKKITLEEISKQVKEGVKQQLNIILKADRKGSVEALTDMLLKLSTDEINVHLVSTGTGAINDGDVLLASASDAMILGFQVRTLESALELAKKEKVEIRIYDIIYQIIDDIKMAIKGMLEPEIVEQLYGKAEIKELFKISHLGTVGGCLVTSGNIHRKGRIKIIRDGVMLYEGRPASLKRFKDDVREVKEGFECGILVENFNDIKVGDILECYISKEVDT
ncbi:MAG: translation initiation factor IF-2 [Candidatus Hydrogenedentota bacterium]